MYLFGWGTCENTDSAMQDTPREASMESESMRRIFLFLRTRRVEPSAAIIMSVDIHENAGFLLMMIVIDVDDRDQMAFSFEMAEMR